MGIAQEASDDYINYHDRMLPKLLGHKGPERVAAVLEHIYDYADNVLPKLVIGRECLRSMYDGDYD